MIILSTEPSQVASLTALIERHSLPLVLDVVQVDKISNKRLAGIFGELNGQNTQYVLTSDGSQLSLVHQNDKGELIKVTNDWQSLTKRIVTAGRKSELLLQACRANADMHIIDATAGFGHDSLILASTGASVLMVEKNPVLALMLLAQKQLMQTNKNWQNLLARLNICCQDFCDVQAQADIVYLDPMFPKGSYHAKVNKNMQILHNLVEPPTADDEINLLNHAKNLSHKGKVLVKRPVLAPFLAGCEPTQSWQNDALRFDGYFNLLD